MKAINAMTTGELRTMVANLDTQIHDAFQRVYGMPRDTHAYAAIEEGRRAMQRFRALIDDELDRRGA